MLVLLLPLCWQAGCESTPRSAEGDGMSLDERTRRAETLAEQADAARRRGRDDRAMEFYRESLEYSTELVDVWNNMGLLFLQDNEYEQALSAFATASELDPRDVRPLTNMGVVYLRTYYAEDALEMFHAALDITPSYLPALRGAIRAADLLKRAEQEDLDRVKRALLAENDEVWRKYFERQKFLIEARLRTDQYGEGDVRPLEAPVEDGES